MGHLNTVPDSARLKACATFHLDADPLREGWPGGKVQIDYHEGFASKGYKSGYEPVPHAWIRLRFYPAERITEWEARQTWHDRCWSFSGRRVAGALAAYTASVDAAIQAGGVLIEAERAQALADREVSA
jgi:hypothetical protein